jgi:RNA-directed DNA polymerase
MQESRNEYSYADWKLFFEESGLNRKYQRAYLRYVYRLLIHQVPVIFEIEHFSKLVGIKAEMLNAMSHSPISFYMHYKIPKRRGGSRDILAPYPSLLHVQRWINIHILSKIEISDYATGFRCGKSIVDNANIHCNRPHLLKMDVKDFFPTIKKDSVFIVFRRLGYAPNVANILTNLCVLNNALPQGAATSPTLSNIVVGKLDYRLGQLSASYNIKYTRYADDFAFSGAHIPVTFQNIVEKIVNEEGFTINPEKTALIRRKGKKIVTGVSVAGEKPALPKETKRKLRQEVFFAIKNYSDKSNRINMPTPMYLESLLGKLNFWHQIEPNNHFVYKNKTLLKQMM